MASKMKVRMIISTTQYPARAIVEVEEAEALRLIAAGYAVKFTALPAELETRVDQIDADVDGLKEDIHDNETGLEVRVSTVEDDIHAVDTGLDARLSKVEDDIFDEETGLEVRVSTVEDDIHGEVTGLEARIAKIEADLYDEVTGLDAKVTDHETRIGALETESGGG